VNHNDISNNQYSISFDGFSQTLDEPNLDLVETISRFLSDQIKSGQYRGATIKPGNRYRDRFVIPLPINDPNPTGSLMFEVLARTPRTANLRIEFRPAKTGSSGIDDACTLLDLITPFGGQHFIRNGILTRYDVAIDIWGTSVDDVAVFSKRSQKHGVYTDRRGVPETVYMGTVRSDRTVAYTKLHKATGQQSLRIERRLKRRLRGCDLPGMADPFQIVQLIPQKSIVPFLDGLIPQQFFDSVRIRGLNRVLKILPAAQRRAITNALNDPAQSLLPSTGEIWRGWPRLLEDSGFGFLHTDTDEASLVPSPTITDDEPVDEPCPQ
jgi:hypothetical protein